MLRIAIGSDDPADVVDLVTDHLRALGHAVLLVALGEDWPEVGRAVGEAVAAGRADCGVCCCHTGTGVSIAANKVPGVRAALCVDVLTAVGARRWNDANVLALSLRLTEPELACAIVDAFLTNVADDDQSEVISRVEP